MHFSSIIAGLAGAASLVSAAQHSGRSLKHVGKTDKHPKLARREQPTQQRREQTFPYLTNITASE